MANTIFSVDSPQTVKLWSMRIYRDFVTDTGMLAAMMEAGIIRKHEDTSENAGDRVRISFLQKQTGAGLIGNESANGNENALVYFTDDLLINQLRYPIEIPNVMTISQQRVVYDLPEDTYKVSMDWLAQRGIVSVLYQLAGFNAATFSYQGTTFTGPKRLTLTGMNTPIAPSANRVLYIGNNTSDTTTNSDTTATFKLSLVDQLEAMAEIANPYYIRPLSENGEIKYHLYVHTFQWQQLIQDTSAPIQFRDIFGNAIASGDGDGGFGRSMLYSQTLILKTDKIPNGLTANDGTGLVLPNVRRAVFCGRDAVAFALGRGYDDGKEIVPGFMIREDVIDIGNTRRVAINALWGAKKVTFNNVDHGVIVIPGYVAQTAAY